MSVGPGGIAADLRQRWPAPSRPRGIVGIGAGGIVNDAHLPAYRLAGLPVAGLYDIDIEKSRATARRFDIERVFASLDEALAFSGAIFDVALPPQELSRMVERLPEGSAALLQKPMGIDLADATAIRDACRRKKITAAVNFQLRFSPNMLALKSAVDAGLLGRLVECEVRVNCHMPWELWPFLKSLERMELNLHSIHYLDLVRSFLGEPGKVHARTVKHPSAKDLASSRTSAILDYGDDVRCCLSVNHHHDHGPRHQASEIRLEGTRGAAVATMGVNLDYPRGRPDTLEIAALEIARRGADWQDVPLVGSWFPDAFGGTMSNLQRFVAGEDAVLHTSVEDAWRTMALVEACYESDRVGGVAVKEG
jgi:predicted dehydrogenase